MAQIGVCIEPFFTGLPYEQRIEKISEIGFRVYEFWFHNRKFDGKALIDEMKNFEKIAELNEKYNLTTSDFVFNHPDGGIIASLIDKKDRNRLLGSIGEMIGQAKKIGCSRFISGSGNRVQRISSKESIENMIESLKMLMDICEKENITILLEPFNTRVDHPDYFLDDPFLCIDIVKRVESPNLKMLYDIYHMQIMSGNLLDFIGENIEYIGHFHIAGVPGRHEPFTGELNYRYIVDEIDRMGYDGYFGLEYWPSFDDEESLRRTRDYFS